MKKQFYLILFIFCLLCSCKKKVSLPVTDTWRDYRKAYSFLNHNTDSAFYYFNRVVTTAKDHQQTAMAYTSMAILQADAGDYFGCQESLTSSLRFLEVNEQANKAALSTNYNELGLASYNLKNYDEAIDFYRKALQLSVDSSYIPVITNNMANAYQQKREYSYAIQLYDSMMEGHKQSKENYARLLANKVFTEWLNNNAYNAAPGLLKSLQLRQQINDGWGQNSSYAYLADFYTRSKPDSAFFYAKKMYATAITLHSADDQLEALQKLIRLSPDIYSKSYFKQYQLLSDSVQTARNAAKNQFALIRYNSERNKADNLKLQKDNTENKYQIVRQRFLLSGVVLLFVLAGITGLFWYQKREQRLKLEARNTVREHQLKTSKKVHDVVANGLYRIMAEIEHRAMLSKEQLLDRIEMLYHQSRDITYEPARQTIEFSQKLGELITSFGDAATRIAVIGNSEAIWQNISEEVRYEVEHILQEMMVNMKKHSKASVVTIKFQRQGHQLDIKYQDNGVGFPEQVKLGTGLTNTENRIKAISGSVTFDSSKINGLQVGLKFPVA